MSNNAGVAPGAGIKFLRTGQSSANMFFLNDLDPLPDNQYNFFAAPLYNHIASAKSPAAIALVQKFMQASACPPKTGLSDAARYVKINEKIIL